MIRTADRLLASFLSVVVLVSPLRELIRLAAKLVAGDPLVTSSWSTFPWYVGGLLLGYALVLGIVVSLRLAVVAVEGEEPPLLRLLDVGVRGNWPWRYGLLLTAVAVVSVGAEDVRGQSAAAAEILAAGVALLIALAGPPEPPRVIEGYDPMPYLDADDVKDDSNHGAAADRIPVSVTWGFCAVPAEIGAPVDRHTIRLTVPADRVEAYARRREELAGDSDNARAVCDGVCRELRGMARRVRAISVAHHYDRIAELNNILAMAAAVCDPGEDEDGACLDGDIQASSRYPIEILLDGHGDGRDWAVLAAAILVLLGHEVGFVGTEGADAERGVTLAVAAPGALDGAELPTDRLGRQWVYYRYDPDTGRFSTSEEAPTAVAMNSLVHVAAVTGTLDPLHSSEIDSLARPWA